MQWYSRVRRVYPEESRLQRATVVAANAWFNNALQPARPRASARWPVGTKTVLPWRSRRRETVLGCWTVSLCRPSCSLQLPIPNADRQNAGIIKEALSLSDSTGSSGCERRPTRGDLGPDPRIANLSESSGKSVLCVAADKRKSRVGSESELLNGDAAAAFLVGNGEPIARFLGSHGVTIDFVDHFRGADAEFDYGWETRSVRDEGYNKILLEGLRAGLRSCQLDPADVDHLIVAVPSGRVAEAIAKKTGIRPEALHSTLEATVGYSGAAHPALMLAHALEAAKPGERIVVASFGQGCDVSPSRSPMPIRVRRRAVG